MRRGSFDEIVLTADDFTLVEAATENMGRVSIGFGF